LKYFFKITVAAFTGSGRPTEVEGLATFDKKVILFGSEGNAKIFASKYKEDAFDAQLWRKTNLPKAVVEVVDPIVLGGNLFEHKHECCCCCCTCDIPEPVVSDLNGHLCYDDDDNGRYLAVSIGIFSVIRIVRPGQYLISATEYVIPDKECISPSNDDPCSVFRSMAFPVAEFGCATTAPHYEKGSGKCGCGS
jgi:hypothetical protein